MPISTHIRGEIHSLIAPWSSADLSHQGWHFLEVNGIWPFSYCTWKSYLSHTSQHVGRSRASHACIPGPTCRVGASKVNIFSFISAQWRVKSLSFHDCVFRSSYGTAASPGGYPTQVAFFKRCKLKNLENALNSRECLNFRKCWKSWGKNASGVTYDSKPRKGGILCRLPSSCLIWFWLRPWLRWGWYGIGDPNLGPAYRTLWSNFSSSGCFVAIPSSSSEFSVILKSG